jgi:deoxyribodipyrimidine photo-lyase
MIETERIRNLNMGTAPKHPRYVLYWMQAAQRTADNHALWYAAMEADRMNLPLVVAFILTEYPGATAVHYRWMLSGLHETSAALASAGIGCLLSRGEPSVVLPGLAATAALLVCDASPTRWARSTKVQLAAATTVPIVEVDGESVIPLRAASDKQEWAARTLRGRIAGAIAHYLAAPTLPLRPPRRNARGLDLEHDTSILQAYAEAPAPGYPGDRIIEQSRLPASGSTLAQQRLELFINVNLDHYDQGRNDPNQDATSGLSAYLHFGQIAPLAVARAASRHGGPGVAAFIEQLVVRRELCRNFAYFRPEDYDEWTGLPAWARTTLQNAAADPRPYHYDYAAFEAARTHDAYWNAAQNQLVSTGTIHNYMRMYWGKMILAWSSSPQEAFKTAIRLNDHYALDGRDPNGWAGVAWCFGLHDRPWPGRAVFGTVRSMSRAGLKRKFDADAYAMTWQG